MMMAPKPTFGPPSLSFSFSMFSYMFSLWYFYYFIFFDILIHAHKFGTNMKGSIGFVSFFYLLLLLLLSHLSQTIVPIFKHMLDDRVEKWSLQRPPKWLSAIEYRKTYALKYIKSRIESKPNDQFVSRERENSLALRSRQKKRKTSLIKCFCIIIIVIWWWWQWCLLLNDEIEFSLGSL